MRVAIITENFLPKRDGVTRTIDMLLEHLQMREQPAIVFAPEGSPRATEARGSSASLAYPFPSTLNCASCFRAARWVSG